MLLASYIEMNNKKKYQKIKMQIKEFMIQMPTRDNDAICFCSHLLCVVCIFIETWKYQFRVKWTPPKYECDAVTAVRFGVGNQISKLSMYHLHFFMSIQSTALCALDEDNAHNLFRLTARNLFITFNKCKCHITNRNFLLYIGILEHVELAENPLYEQLESN